MSNVSLRRRARTSGNRAHLHKSQVTDRNLIVSHFQFCNRHPRLGPSRNRPVVMYIYQAMDTGVPEDENEDVDENMRVIEVEGQLTKIVGIRYKPVESGAAASPAGLALTDDGKLVDTSSQSDDVDDSEYWADRPSGFLGGKRLTSTLSEDIAVRPPCSSAELRCTRSTACILTNFSMRPS